MKKTTLFAALVSMIAINATAQNVWDGSSISTISTNGKVAIGTTTPTNGYTLTVKNTSNTQASGILNEINNNNTSSEQTGFKNTVTFTGSTGTKSGFSQIFTSSSTSDNYGLILTTTASTVGNRFGLVSTIGNNTKTDCAIYSVVGPPGWGFPMLPSGDRSGYFIGAFEVVARSNDEKIFIINNRNFSQAGFGTDVFRIYGNGKMYATEIFVKLSSQFPDYVFAPDYQLMSIYDLKNYITKNKHLPNIPPANEVENEGLNVGEMNTKLVEKVEELTLYIIQQQEQIDALKKELETIKH